MSFLVRGSSESMLLSGKKYFMDLATPNSLIIDSANPFPFARLKYIIRRIKKEIEKKNNTITIITSLINFYFLTGTISGIKGLCDVASG